MARRAIVIIRPDTTKEPKTISKIVSHKMKSSTPKIIVKIRARTKGMTRSMAERQLQRYNLLVSLFALASFSRNSANLS